MSMMNELAGLKNENGKRKENFFVRFIKYFIPWKGDGFSEVLRKLVFAASIVVFCISVSDLSDYLNGNAKTNELIEEMQTLKPTISSGSNTGDNAQSVVHPSGDESQSGEVPPQGGNSVEFENTNTEVGDSWKPLLEVNKDVRGWLSIDTFKDSNGEIIINYPVVQGPDNDYYLTRDIKKNYSGSGGTIYMDYASTIVPGVRTDNITIFGHNMLAGTFFARLEEYKSGVDFLKANPLITFNTVYSAADEKYIILYCGLFNIYEKQDNGNVFKYVGYRDFDEDHPFDKWKEEMSKRSWYSSDIDVKEDDQFITLSTCSGDIGDMRWVVVARKLRPNEDVDALVQTYRDRPNEEIYFPQRCIYAWGIKRVYRH